MARTPVTRLIALVLAAGVTAGAPSSAPPAGVTLQPKDTVPGYLARLLVNETPFPGERGWISEADTKAGMLAILWVLHSRIHHVPPGYVREQIAATRSDDIIDVITAGGERGQVDGFYRDAHGRFVAIPRVHERVEYLVRIANQGKPGRFARLLEYAQGLAGAYVESGPAGADRFARLHRVGTVPVTGRAYAWMANADFYDPGGNFVRIPNEDSGALAGNRFFTLRRLR
jgi:hypothetical protein